MTPEEILQVEKDIVATLKNIYDLSLIHIFTLVRAIKFIGPTLTSIFGALEPLTKCFRHFLQGTQLPSSNQSGFLLRRRQGNHSRSPDIS